MHERIEGTAAAGLTRRRVLSGGLVIGAIAVTRTACSNEGRGGGVLPEAGDGNAAIPNYIRYDGVQGDLLGEEFGIADGFLRYPADPVTSVPEPPGDGQPIRTMTGTTRPIPPRLQVNTFWQQLNEAVGSPVEASLTPVEDYGDRFATMVAGNRLPDIFQVAGVPQRAQMLAATAIDLTPLLSGDNIAAYPNLANLQTVSWRSGLVNGRLYGIPVTRGAISTEVMYSRADVLDEMGVGEVPTSLDDFVTLCREITDPRANRWALSTPPLRYVRQMFGVPNEWSLDGDSLVSWHEHPGQLDAFEAMRKLWADGQIHPDAFVGLNQDLKVRFANGTSLLVQDTFSGWQAYAQLMQPEQRIRILPVPLADGSGPGTAHLGGPTIHTVSINKNAEGRAETLLKYLDYLAAPFGTKEYLFTKFGTLGVHHEVRDGNPVLNDKGLSETQLELRYQADAPWAIYIPEMEGGSQALFDAQVQVVPTAIENPVAGLYSETGVSKGSQLNTPIDDAVEDIIQGRRPVSAWTEEVARWKSAGGDRIRDELLQALQETQ